MSGSAQLTIALYSEDRRAAERDFDALREVVLGMLDLLLGEPMTASIACEPAQPARKERVCGSYWKMSTGASGPDREKRTLLVGAIATALRRHKLVIFHIDADATWADRERAEYHRHLERFTRDIRQLSGLGQQLDHYFIPAVPFYEFESWAYANRPALLDLLTDDADLAAVEAWLDDLTKLDEIPDIKDKLSIEGRHSHDLVNRRRGFPAAELAAAGKSYAATLDRLRRSSAVLALSLQPPKSSMPPTSVPA